MELELVELEPMELELVMGRGTHAERVVAGSFKEACLLYVETRGESPCLRERMRQYMNTGI